MKNIWIINQYAGSPFHGMNFRSYYFAKEFIRNGINVTIITASFSHGRSRNPENIIDDFSTEFIDKIKYVWVKTPKYSGSKSIGRILSLFIFPLRLLKYRVSKEGKPDIIIVSSPSPIPVINAYLFSRKYKSKIFFEVRDLWPLSLKELGNSGFLNPLIFLLQRIENFAYRIADRVISVLPCTQEYMMNHGMGKSKFVHIPNGIDSDEKEYNDLLPDNIIKKIPENKFIVGYAGTIGIANAIDPLIEAVRLLQDYTGIHFVLVGDGGEKARIINSSKNLNNITFIDAIPKAQVPSMLSFFDVCYIGWNKKSLYEHGISANKLFDYMLSKKPILHSVNAGNDPVKEANCGISVEAEDPNAIADGILRLYHMTYDKRQKLGNNGYKVVLEKYTYQYLSGKYMELF